MSRKAGCSCGAMIQYDELDLVVPIHFIVI